MSSDLLRSVLEEVEEPSRPHHLSSQGLSPSPQLAIRGDERDRLTRDSPSHDIDKRVIATAFGMDHGDAIAQTAGHALAKLAFEDHDDGLVDPFRIDGGPYPTHEGSGRFGSVPPPTCWTRADDIRCVDEKHGMDLSGYVADLR
jgi:hypothetical protein